MRINGASGVRNLQYHRFAVSLHYLSKGQCVEVLRFVIGNLLSVHRQRLGKVTVAIQETYCCQVDVAVAGFFQIVTSQYTQAAGIDFQHVGQTIFHAEIGNRWFCLIRLDIYIILEY